MGTVGKGCVKEPTMTTTNQLAHARSTRGIHFRPYYLIPLTLLAVAPFGIIVLGKV